MKKTRTKTKKKKLGIHHRIHRHIKKHLKKHYQKFKKKKRIHKVMILMSITLPLILGALLFGSSALYIVENYEDKIFKSGGGNGKEEISVNLPIVKDDTANWKTYQDELTGFSIKYPNIWSDPKVESGNRKGANYLRRVTFDNELNPSDERYKGFEVFVYDSRKFPGPVGTDNLVEKNSTSYSQNNCDKAEFYEASVGEEDYPAQEVDISPDNQCFQEAFFYSVTEGKYTVNIVPLVNKVDNPIGENSRKTDVIAVFPKYFEILSTLVLPQTEIKNIEEKSSFTRNVVKKPEVKPHRVLISKARCAHKNDHPRKSKTKGHHMDEDCCMDPDESPDPRCQY